MSSTVYTVRFETSRAIGLAPGGEVKRVDSPESRLSIDTTWKPCASSASTSAGGHQNREAPRPISSSSGSPPAPPRSSQAISTSPLRAVATMAHSFAISVRKP